MTRSKLNQQANALLARLSLTTVEVEVSNAYDPQDFVFEEVKTDAYDVELWADMFNKPLRWAVRTLALVPSAKESFTEFVNLKGVA